MFPFVDNSLQKTAHAMFPAALTTQLSPAFPSMQGLKIQDSQRRWKLSGESHITSYPREYTKLIKAHFSWQRKYLLMLLNRNFISFSRKYEN